MKGLSTYTQFNSFFVIVAIPLMCSGAFASPISQIQEKSLALADQTEKESIKAQIRWGHAKELLGKEYHKSVVKSGEKISNLDEMLENWTRRALRKNWKKSSKEISQFIIHQSNFYHFDPIFLMAVIENESSFDTEIVGGAGEIGLMQITPKTGEWIAKKSDIPWKGKESLKDPLVNIRIGAAYLSYLRGRFDSKSGLYIAAYNMGTSNVYKSLNKQIVPKIYAGRVMQRYLRFYSELKDEINSSTQDIPMRTSAKKKSLRYSKKSVSNQFKS